MIFTGTKSIELSTQTQPNATVDTAENIVPRNRVLFVGAARAGSVRFDAASALIHYEVSPGRAGRHIAQESLDYAVALAETGTDIDRIPRIVEATLRGQDRDRKSLTYGNFRWMNHDTQVLDPNAVSFMVPHYHHLLRHHGALLGDALTKQLRDAIDLAGHALLAHRAQWAYSNIFLLNILAKLQIADLLDDSRLQQTAFWDFEEWLANTSRFGIVEFNSPVYSAVQISALEGMLDLQIDPSIHQRVRAILALYYVEAFTYYHPATERFAGAKSRHAHVFRHESRHPMHALLYRQTGQPKPVDVVSHAGYALSNYRVGDEVRRLAFEKDWPVAIEQAAPHNGLTRRAWMTPQFALSSMTGGRYGKTDVPVEVLAADGDTTCQAILEGEPHLFDVYTSHQNRLLVGAARWRFCPPTLRGKKSGGTQIPFRVGYGSHYVPLDTQEVVLRLQFVADRQAITVRFGDTEWNGEPLEVAEHDPLCVQVGDVLIGYRGPGLQVIRSTEHGFSVDATLASPAAPPWWRVQPFLIYIGSIEHDGSAEKVMRLLRDAELRRSDTAGGMRIESVVNGKPLEIDIAETPAVLMKSGGYKWIAERLTEAIATDKPALNIWDQHEDT